MVATLIRVGPFFFLLWSSRAWGFIRAMNFDCNYNHRRRRRRRNRWCSLIPKMAGSETLKIRRGKVRLVKTDLLPWGCDWGLTEWFRRWIGDGGWCGGDLRFQKFYLLCCLFDLLSLYSNISNWRMVEPTWDYSPEATVVIQWACWFRSLIGFVHPGPGHVTFSSLFFFSQPKKFPIKI